MNKYKKILSGFLLSSLILGNFSFSFAQIESVTIPTQEEKIKVEAEVLKLQSNLFSNSKTYFEKLVSDFEKLTNYEESGNSKIEFLLDEPSMFGKADMSFDLKDYKVKNSSLDSELSGNISLKANYSPVYGSGFEFNLSTFATLISKDSEMYGLLKDFDFKVNDENISKILDALKNEFKDNKYIKLPTDKNSKATLEMMKNFKANVIIEEAQNISSKPLLQTYKKTGNKFLLVPTKYACDEYFKLEQKFNFSNRWYTPETCTNSTYKSFVKEFTKTGELYLTIDDSENTLGFYAKNDDNTTIDFSLKYNAKNIQSIDFIVTPDQKKYKNEGLNFHFKSKEFLKVILNAEKGTIFINFDSELDENNNFKEINSNIKSKDLNGSFALKDKKITGFYVLKQRGYDYTSENFEYKLKNVFAVKISGNTDTKNLLEKLNLQFAGVDIKNKKAIFTGKTSFNKGNFALKFSSKSDYSSFDFNGVGFISSKIFKLNSDFNSMGAYKGNFDILIDQSDDNNNAKINLTINNNLKDILKINIENLAKRTYKDDVKIEIPNDFKEFDPTIFQELNY